MTTKQLFVRIDNQPGRLLEILEIIGAAGVNMRTLTMAEENTQGILRVLADYPEKAEKALADKGYSVGIAPVLMVEMGDRPGSTYEVLRVLSQAGINVEYTYAFVAPGGLNRAFMVLRVRDNSAAEDVLTANGVAAVALEDVF